MQKETNGKIYFKCISGLFQKCCKVKKSNNLKRP